MSVFLLTACERREVVLVDTPLQQHAYVWQRDWSVAVQQGVMQAWEKLDGLVVLGAQIDWKGEEPSVSRPAINWAVLKASHQVGMAVRVGPYGGAFQADSLAVEVLKAEVALLLERARQEGVKLSQVQVDFDCAQKRLAGYGVWLRALKEVMGEVPLLFTALPVWLDEPECEELCQLADGWVLQAHSVAIPHGDQKPVLCDVKQAGRWMKKAASFGKPFWMALPTYRSYAGINAHGKVLGISSEGPKPAWPEGTRVIEFAANAVELAELVAEWRGAHPALLEGIMWYRLPVETDRNNWRWKTFEAVVAGRRPEAKLEVQVKREAGLVDLAVINLGDDEGEVTKSVQVNFESAGSIQAAEALSGWRLERRDGGLRFQRENRSRLLPGERRGIGWLRITSIDTASLHAHFID